MMNYGLSQMQIGNYSKAEEYFQKGLQLWPYYPYLYTNMAILKSSMGDPVTAEAYFKKALEYGRDNIEAYYYYGDFLLRQNRKEEALYLLNETLRMSPAHIHARYHAMLILGEFERWAELKEHANAVLAILPEDKVAAWYLDRSLTAKSSLDAAIELASNSPTPENFLSLSLEFYKKGKYMECIEACYEALKLKPDFAEAHNNICSAYNELGEHRKAEAACNEAIRINPEYTLAMNNRATAQRRMQKFEPLLSELKGKPTPDGFLNLSLLYYYEGMYYKCIEACRSALQLKPDYAPAYNNICSAYNQLKKHKEALEACDKAIQFDPSNELAKNNRIIALRGIGQ
jgi:protein O-mannosyl-transferase